ncbi:hypothetical protein [Castellaniella sp.]|uniref:hypothetical protein n=1 Tax=Castellaniella sp. TaxID=1955812 RepID=UPI002AFE9EB8|nr:hypothetical protein [Castellaniella sp.]
MELIDNISRLLGDDLKQTIKPRARLKIAASCFSMYAFEALKAELEKIDELEFIFTSPAFVANEATDKIRKEHREFYIPKLNRERSLYGSEFEIQLRNKLTQRAVAKECAQWMQRKAKFRSNRTKAPMQSFACIQANGTDTAYMPLHGFTAVDLGCRPSGVARSVSYRSQAAARRTRSSGVVMREPIAASSAPSLSRSASERPQRFIQPAASLATDRARSGALPSRNWYWCSAIPPLPALIHRPTFVVAHQRLDVADDVAAAEDDGGD